MTDVTSNKALQQFPVDMLRGKLKKAKSTIAQLQLELADQAVSEDECVYCQIFGYDQHHGSPKYREARGL